MATAYETGREIGRRYAAAVPDKLLPDADAYRGHAERLEYAAAAAGMLPAGVGTLCSRVITAKQYFAGMAAGIAEVRTERLAKVRATDKPSKKRSK